MSLHSENFLAEPDPHRRRPRLPRGRRSLSTWCVWMGGWTPCAGCRNERSITRCRPARASDWFARTEARRQQQHGGNRLTVAWRKTAPQVDGRLDDWPATTDWAAVDRRGTRAFLGNSQPYQVTAAVAVTDTHLYAAWRTTEKDLLANSGETPTALFKHGGCLDLMLAADPTAPADRAAPAAGDVRLLVTRVNGKTRAVLYRARTRHHRPGRLQQPVANHSPRRGGGRQRPPSPWRPTVTATTRSACRWPCCTGSRRPGRPTWATSACCATGRDRRRNAQPLEQQGDGDHRRRPSEAELTPRLWGKWRLVRGNPLLQRPSACRASVAALLAHRVEEDDDAGSQNQSVPNPPNSSSATASSVTDSRVGGLAYPPTPVDAGFHSVNTLRSESELVFLTVADPPTRMSLPAWANSRSTPARRSRSRRCPRRRAGRCRRADHVLACPADDQVIPGRRRRCRHAEARSINSTAPPGHQPSAPAGPDQFVETLA
ncbi:MAG: hypothetical protein U0736_21030 [Gemmataceae bacterium]